MATRSVKGEQWEFATQVKILEFQAHMREISPGCEIQCEQFRDFTIDNQIVSVACWNKDKTERAVIKEPAEDFPSEKLMTQLRLLLQ